MRHVDTVSRLPALAADDVTDPAADGFISARELMDMILAFIPTAMEFAFSKRGWQYWQD